MKKNIHSIMLPPALVERIQQKFNKKNRSDAIRTAIGNSLLGEIEHLEHDDFMDFLRLEFQNPDERKARSSFSVRLDQWMVDALTTITGKSLSESVFCALLVALRFNLPNTPSFGKSLKTIHVLGSKWDTRMSHAIHHISETANITWSTSVETCAGALGIHANHQVAENEVINDDDAEKINFYRCVKEFPLELKCMCIFFTQSEESFNDLKEDKNELASKSNVYAAMRYFILNYLSARNTGNTYKSVHQKTFFKKLDSFYPLHLRLQNVTILEKDIFKIVRNYKNSENTILIVDPPYLDTNVYTARTIREPSEHGTEFGMDEHKKLAKLLCRCKCHFMYFCRITASRRKDNHHNLKDTPQQIAEADTILKGKIDDLYYGKDLFFKDVCLDDGTVERIITNFPFKNAVTYTNEEVIL